MEIRQDPYKSDRIDLYSISYETTSKKKVFFNVEGVKKYVWLLGAILSWLGWATKIEDTANKVVVYVNKNSFFGHLTDAWVDFRSQVDLVDPMDRKKTIANMNKDKKFTQRLLTEQIIADLFQHVHDKYVAQS